MSTHVMPQAAMVFAAGFGTRMGELTRARPKPLLQAGPSTLLDHTLDQVAESGISRAVVNLHYRGEMIERHLARRTDPQIEYSWETPEILDTGGGIVHALDLLDCKRFATVNADTVFIGANPFDVLAQSWNRAVADALLLLVPVGQTLGYTRQGDFFLEAPDAAPRRRGQADSAPFVYAGAQIIGADVFADAPDGAFSLNVIWNRLLARDRVRAVVYPDQWIDVGTPEGLALADRALTCLA